MQRFFELIQSVLFTGRVKTAPFWYNWVAYPFAVCVIWCAIGVQAIQDVIWKVKKQCKWE